MAHRFEKGKSIYFLFKNGYTVQDSQLKPRYYLERKKAKEYLPYGDEIVEYAPVVHGEWEYVDFVSPTIHCSVCKGLAPMDCCGDYHSERTDFCPHCGAKMQGGKDE